MIRYFISTHLENESDSIQSIHFSLPIVNLYFTRIYSGSADLVTDNTKLKLDESQKLLHVGPIERKCKSFWILNLIDSLLWFRSKMILIIFVGMDFLDFIISVQNRGYENVHIMSPKGINVCV